MRVTKKMLSLPPYLSTSWKNVATLQVRLSDNALPILMVKLLDGSTVEIPGLSQLALNQIFAIHSEVIENDEMEDSPTASAEQTPDQVIGIPIRLGAGGPENFGGMLQHDRSQANAPDLPPEILGKISAIAQILGAENAENLPQAEADCNCFHCQIARAIGKDATTAVEQETDEEISDDDLRFRTWDIAPSDQGKDFYMVTDPESPSQRYTVFLGDPIGCTCGEKHCQHVQAVLKSSV